MVCPPPLVAASPAQGSSSSPAARLGHFRTSWCSVWRSLFSVFPQIVTWLPEVLYSD
ncbi:hypothetical protein M3B11_02240 [Brevibacterium sp. p3-SID960]|uniref:hypothetical protein n=1 Tax=Brevibacterium sp. p3-SID960 TaxID=2916063 RepID=UPI0021A71A63|nr:hypothetical protein [Brevibacterium sp. p3-SID960]MCT1689788.1 hypothetical protein [Brevibacterium sp. p3-SID960]